MKNLLIIVLALGLTIVSYAYFSQQTQTSKTPSTKNSTVVASLQKASADHNIEVSPSITDSLISQQSNSNESDTIEAQQPHYNIPSDIKQAICLKDSNDSRCTINISSPYDNQIFDKDNNLLSAEILTVLTSSNFDEVLNNLASKKTSNESYINEANYNDELYSLIAQFDVSSDGVFCNNNTCGVSIKSKDEHSLEQFNRGFGSNNTGNIFISAQDIDENNEFESRILFFPGNNNGVISRK